MLPINMKTLKSEQYSNQKSGSNLYTSEVKGEIKQISTDCDAAISKYQKQLVTGAGTIEPTYTDFINTLDKCKYDTYLNWLQEEYDKYLKTVNN